MTKRRALHAASALFLAGCVPVQRSPGEEVEILLIPAPIAAPAGFTPSVSPVALGARVPITPQSFTALDHLRMDVPANGAWIAARRTLPADSFPYSTRAGVLTFGGPARDPVSVLRVLEVDTTGRRTAAGELRRAAPGMRKLVIVPGPVGPRELHALVLTVNEIAAAARAAGVHDVVVAVPGADTVSYPSRPLASVSDALLITFEPPAPGTPGAPVTAEEMRRTIGLRASEVGRARLLVLLPTHGFVWEHGSPARAISFEEGARLADEWRVPLRRDQASDALYARSAQHGELWLADGRFVARLAREARAMGIRRFAVVLGAGEDAALAESLAVSLQTTNSSR